MLIMIFDVPAESGGALTILNQYYDAAIKDKKYEWIFVVSTPKLKEADNVRVLNYPWIKKSWFHRVYFDKFIAIKILDKYKVDKILSLQNVVVPKTKVKQTLYLHQSLPFVNKRYRINENFKFWLYQNVISKMVFKSILKADKVIVQTKWMRDAAVKKTNVSIDKFIIEQPKAVVNVKRYYQQNLINENLFFYPASSAEYKNHSIIIEASRILKKDKIKNYKVILTLNGSENNNIKKLYKIILKEDLPIDLIGSIDLETVYDYYSRSTLIFPSFIETLGLPLLEAKIHYSPILASDCAFSHEILDGYEKVQFFNPFNPLELAELLKKNILQIIS